MDSLVLCEFPLMECVCETNRVLAVWLIGGMREG